MKLVINQDNNVNSVELVTSGIIDKLYNLSKGDTLSQDSYLRGRITATSAYADAVEYLNTKWGPDLVVSADKYYIGFEDPEVERVLMANNFSSDGIGITTADAAVKQITNIFNNNTVVRSFDELPYFLSGPNLLVLKGCTNLQSINLSGYTGSVALAQGTNPTYFMGENSEAGYLECGFSANVINCSNLKHVKFLESCPNLATNAFRGAGIEIIEMVPKANWNNGGWVFDGCPIKETHIENEENYWTVKWFDSGIFGDASSKIYLNGVLTDTITVPQGTTEINDGVWLGARAITTINWNGTKDYITKIGKASFKNCGINFGDLTLLACTEIGDSAFYSCTFGHLSLSSVTTIGGSSFNGATMTRLTISHNLTTVGNSAFNNVHNLTRVDTDSLDAWLSINFNSETSNPLYYAGNLYVNDSLVTTVDFTGKTEVKSYVFRGCTVLTSVTLPNTITSIGDKAFGDCTSLSTVTGYENVTFVGYDAFYRTPFLTNQPDGIVYIGKVVYAYNGYMPSNTSITFAPGTTHITKRAFTEAKNKANLVSVSIPNSVSSVGEEAFDGCTNLATANISTGMSNIPYRMFRACGLTSITIPSNITTISQDAFYNTKISSIVIPDSVTSIGNWAFADCPYLTDVTIGTGITSIGSAAFKNVSVIVINGVTFTLRSTLTVTIYATTPPSIGANNSKPFDGYGSITIYVPSESLDAYKTATNWKVYKDYIQAIPNT